MFKKKVGSDACLVLDAVIDTDTGVFTIAQTFSMDDLIEATKTRVVVVRAEATGYFFNGFCTHIIPETGFVVFGAVSNGNVFMVLFSESDGVWSGTFIGD